MMFVARCGANGAGGACLLCPGSSDVNLFRYGKGIIDLDAEVSDGAFNFGVAEQELHSSQITGAPVDQGCLGPS
jgi:hypothetical protein